MDRNKSGSNYLLQYEIRKLLDRTPPTLYEDRTYPILVKSKVRCWSCHELFNEISRCAKCKCVRYCSKMCQEADWKRHRHICKSRSFYNKSKWAVIFVRQIPVRSEDVSDVTETCFSLMNHHKIHPDNLRLDIRSNGNKEFRYSYPLFNLESNLNLLLFMEHGLNPQEIINNEWFGSFDTSAEANATTILEYGNGSLRFPLQNYDGSVEWLIDRGCDPNEIMDPRSIVNDIDKKAILYLASSGYDFYREIYQNRTPMISLLRDDQLLALEVEKIIGIRPKEIRKMISKFLIPVLGRIVIEYL